MLTDAQSIITIQGFRGINESLNQCENRNKSEPECWFHCVPKFTSFVHRKVHNQRTIRTIKSFIGDQESCQLVMKRSFIENNFDQIIRWFSSSEITDFEKREPFDLPQLMLNDLKSYKGHFSHCFDILGNKFQKPKDVQLRDRIVYRCGSVYRLPHSEEYLNNENTTYEVEDVLPKITARKREALKKLDAYIKGNLTHF